jgi:hypothetical protein
MRRRAAIVVLALLSTLAAAVGCSTDVVVGERAPDPCARDADVPDACEIDADIDAPDADAPDADALDADDDRS